jgi:hypothetical protein
MNTQPKQNLRRVFSLTAITIVVTFATVSGFLLHGASKKSTFDGELTVTVCRKLPNGSWEVIDKARGNTSLEASLVELASSKEFTSNHVWNPTTEKGRRISTRLVRAGKVNADLNSGRFDITSLPIETVVDGKRIIADVPLTTESISAPNGESLTGKRARIVNRQAEIGLVGVSKPVVVNHEEQYAVNKRLVDKKKNTEELIFIVKATGRIAAK